MEISATLLPSLPTPCSSSSLASSNSLYLNNRFYKKTNNLILRPCQKRNGSGFSCRSMFGLGVPEIVVIAGVTTLLFGPKMVPELGKSIGQTVKSFQQAAKEFESELKRESESATETSTDASVVSEDQQDVEVSGRG